MSLTRAFTTRRVKHALQFSDASDGIPQRSHTTKGSIGGSIRNKISGPVELIHTTNMLSYNAPDIKSKSASSTASSTKSDDDSDTALTSTSSPPTSPDSPFPPKNAESQEPNHLSCYFVAPGQSASNQPRAQADTPAPTIPQRAPSHTKKSYEALTRHRSVSRLSEHSSRSLSTKASFSFSRSSSSSTNTSVRSRTSVGAHHVPKVSVPSPASSTPTTSLPSSTIPVRKSDGPETHPIHPFGHELAQVTELAEEYGVSEDLLQGADEEMLVMAQHGLVKFRAEVYCAEIQDLFSNFFADAKSVPPLWI